MSKYIDQLAERKLKLNELQSEITILAIQARNEGDSWIQIARALGTTKQAAQRRFSKYIIERSNPGDGA